MVILSTTAEAGTGLFSQLLGSLTTDPSSAAAAGGKMMLCWTCPLVQGLYKALGDIANSALTVFKVQSLRLLGIGALFYILFRILSFFVGLQPISFWDAFSDFLRFFGRVLFAVVMLLFIKDIFIYLLNPLLEMSLAVAKKIQESRGFTVAVENIVSDSAKSAIPGYGAESCDSLMCDNVATQAILGQKICTQIIQIICTFNTTLVVGMAMACALIRAGATKFDNGSYVENIYHILTGGFMGAGFVLLMIRLPALYLDAIFRLAFVSILSPIYIILWVFPKTVPYAKKAWDIFLHTCVFFICLSGFVILVAKLLSYVLGSGNANQEEVIALLLNGNYDEAISRLGLFGSSLLSTVAFCFVGTRIMDMAAPLTSQLVGYVPEMGIGTLYGKFSGKLFKWATELGKGSS